MKTKICYNVDTIKHVLEENGYYFVKLPTTEESEDWGRASEQYYFAKPEVMSIEHYHYFYTSAVMKMMDGSKYKLYDSNVNVNDETLLRIDNNDFVSPVMRMNDVWIEATDKVTNWLLTHGATMELLKSSMHEFTTYETVEYYGVPSPAFLHGYWSYSSETLVLNEKEIETVLNSIEDELLRKKIECILYARVFKRKS